MNEVTLLIPAAGSSSRMRGEDKLLEFIDGEAQLARVVNAALATGAQVWVTLATHHAAREAVLEPHPNLTVLDVPDSGEGMSASLRKAAETRISTLGLMIIPADMPELETSDFQCVTEHFLSNPNIPARGVARDGAAGHPVIIPKRLFEKLADLTGDEGARSVLQGEQITPVPLPGQRAILDLDTPEAWAAWRSGRE